MITAISPGRALTTLRLSFIKITSSDVAIFLEIANSPGICFFQLYQRINNSKGGISSHQLTCSLDRLLGSSRTAAPFRYSLIVRKCIGDGGYYLSEAGKDWVGALLNERSQLPVA